MSAAQRALADLQELVSFGPRFHGTPGIHAAADWLVAQAIEAGYEPVRQSVALEGWQPGSAAELTVTVPIARSLPAWPMLGSGGSDAAVSGRVVELGPQGIWGDSQVWQHFAVIDDDGSVLAYLHGRDGGPAAPQPLPAGSDHAVPHLAIGHLDAQQLTEWLGDDKHPIVELRCDASPSQVAVADNIIVDVPGSTDTRALVCGHYDSFFNTVGAYDNGSGTIALLHLLRAWRETPPARSLRIVFFTAEEWHLAGSRFYVDAARSAETDRIDDLDFVLNIDGLGRGDFLEAFASPESFNSTLHMAIEAYGRSVGRPLRIVSRFPPTTGTDDASFYRAGVPSAFMTFNDLHRLHQPEDLPNEGIASNIAWTVGLARHLVDTLPRADRFTPPGIL